ncbi:MAG: isoleucine--tRNA ligase [Cytophagales bacterium]|tara:strand:+ start:999 stop:4343 length:3345 start_codon:yes stop_codon:yes gene_type:complete
MGTGKFNEQSSIDYYKVSKEIISYWNSNNIFEKSISSRSEDKIFPFYEGPPSANGMPGIHHVMARTIKDIFCRYKTLKGYRVYRKGGWDTHGLPVELQVEKNLGITKDDIGNKISIEKYNEECKVAVMQFKEAWEELTESIGYWLDIDDAYITFKNNYIESIWWSLKELYKKGLLYKGYTIQPYSPAAGTGLSSHELNMPGAYKNIKDTSLTAQFKIQKNKKSQEIIGDSDCYFLAWTTTPWTLPANNGLAVGEKIKYNLIETFNKYTESKINVIIAEKCIEKFFDSNNLKTSEELIFDKQNLPYKILKTFKGKDLIGFDYDQLLPYVKAEKPAFTVVSGDFVTTDEGTGIVHISLTFGSDDFYVSKKNNLPGIFVKNDKNEDIPIVDKSGKFVKEIIDFAGLQVKAFSDVEGLTTDEQISIKLKKENKAFDVKKYEHSYPHCWRTDKPILYYPLESWFINSTKLKDDFINKNKDINWQPESTGTGRFGNWLENLVDWNLSRSRFWGTPLPIWRTKDGKDEICIGSINELKSEIKKSVDLGFMKNNISDNIDLHRPFVDEIILASKEGSPMYRETDIIDVWYDSGSMPFAQYHYPFENKDIFDKMFPAKFIAEGVDQTRGWFFTLHAISIMLFGKVSYENVISNGLVLDKDGNKMSKRLGNAVDPFEVIKKFGPDATRLYMVINSNPWDNLKFDIDGISEILRKFFGTLNNTYNFFALYANIDGFTGNEKLIPYEKRSYEDKWIISKLNSLIKFVEDKLDNYDPTKSSRQINKFINDDLSNWYIRLNRKRFWKGDLTEDKLMAYQTLLECLYKISIISSPFIPFYSEKLFKNLNAFNISNSESVHLLEFPKVDNERISEVLERKMSYAQSISSLVHSIRKKEKIRVRQPLSKISIPMKSLDMENEIKDVEKIILSEINVKEIEYVHDNSKVFTKKIKPNYKELGSIHGKNMKIVAERISSMTQDEITQLEKDESINFELDGGLKLDLLLNQVEILFGQIEGKQVASNDTFTIALDISIDNDLLAEGVSREFINKIQNQRKEIKLEVTDKIEIYISNHSKEINSFLLKHKNFICNETQSINLITTENIDMPSMMDIDIASNEVALTEVKFKIKKV